MLLLGRRRVRRRRAASGPRIVAAGAPDAGAPSSSPRCSLLAAAAAALAFAVVYALDVGSTDAVARALARARVRVARGRAASCSRSASSSPRSSRSTYPPPAQPAEQDDDRADRRGERRARSRASACSCSPAARRVGALGARARHARRLARPGARHRPALHGRRGGAAAGSSTSTAGRCAPTTIEQETFYTAYPEGADREQLGAPLVVVRLDPARARPARRSAQGWAPRRDRRLLEDLHARGLRGLALPRADVRAGRAEARRSSARATTRRSTRRRGGEVLFGPAGRPLPQLPLAIDGDGDLRAAGNFSGRGRPVVVGRAQPEAEGVIRGSSSATSTSAPAAAPFVTKALRYVFPDHWSFLLGEVALYSFVLLVATGIYLTLFFEPSVAPTRLPRLVRAAATARTMSAGVPLGRRPLARRQGGAADPADPPLGGERLHRRDRAAPAARLLHRRVPQAARPHVLHRPDDARRSRCSRATSATRSSTTCSRGWASRSATRSRCRSRSSARTSRCSLWGGPFPGGPAFWSRMYIAHVLLLPIADRRRCSRCTCCSSRRATTRSSAARRGDRAARSSACRRSPARRRARSA